MLGPRLTPSNIVLFFDSPYIPDGTEIVVHTAPGETTAHSSKHCNVVDMRAYDDEFIVFAKGLDECSFCHPRDEITLPFRPYSMSIVSLGVISTTYWWKCLCCDIRRKILSFM